MKTLLALALLSLVALPEVRAAEEGKHLFILSGQSNMARLDPKVSFTPAVEAKFGQENVIVVKDAEGGQPIRRWDKGWKDAPGGKAGQKPGDLYARLMEKVTAAAKGQKLGPVTFFWMQGERDAKEKNGEVYEASFQRLVAQLKADLKRDDIHVVIGRLSDFDLADAKYPHWTKIREIQVKMAEANPAWAWVDTDDLNGEKNDLHLTADGYRILGERYAEKAVALIGKREG
jgi:hypothetical protein